MGEPVNGLVDSVQRVPRGSELVTAAASTSTTLFLDSVEDFDNAGGDLEINGVRYEYVSSDLDLDSILLATGLTAAGAVGDSVFPVSGGQIEVDYIAYVSMGDGDPAEVVIPFGERPLWPEGVYPDPVPVVLSSDLENIVDVSGRVPVIEGTVVQTGSTGARVVILPIEDQGGAIQFFTGMDDELPGQIASGLTGLGRAAVTLDAPALASDTYQPGILLVSGDETIGAGGAQITIDAPKVDLSGRLQVFGTMNIDQILPLVGTLKLGDTATPVRADGTWKFGTSTVNIATLNTVTSLTVVFSPAFGASSSIPVVNLTPETNSPNQVSASIASVSRSGFIIRAYRNAGATGNVDFHWTALSGPA